MTGSATGSTLSHLEGAASGATYDADRLHGVDPADGKPLLARYDLDAAGRALHRATVAGRRTGGMWRWRELLPVRDHRHVVHLGEGATPLRELPRLGRQLGAPRLLVKAEGGNPTGSFKARGMAAAVSRAVELGVERFIVPSAGNAAAALAAYGAAAGVPVVVVMPADAPRANQIEVQATGAALVLVKGFITDCGRVAASLGAHLGAFDVSTLKEPYRVEGKKTMGFELAEDLGWRLPDVVVYPTGGGTGLIGMWKAFDELEAVGLVGSERPAMVAVQARGCAPIVRAFDAGHDQAEPWETPVTRAAGIRVPAAIGDFLILDGVRASGGTAVAVDESDIDATQRLAGRLGAGYVSPESAAAFGAVPELVRRGLVGPRSRVVVFDTGVGQKYPPPPLPEPPVVEPDDVDVERLAARLGTAPQRTGEP